MERARSNSYQPFAPISIAGHSSRTETVLFYTRGEEEQPLQIIREPQAYQFNLRLDEAVMEVPAPFAALLKRAPAAVTFERKLRYYDARAFINGTLPLYAKDWRSTVSGRGQ
jgi:hypothetical protein